MSDGALAAWLDPVIAAVDAANAEDPNRATVRGRTGPRELLHAQLMTDWVLRLDPAADAAQIVAARAHHLRRWESPRSAYPEGRAGYLRWRTAAKRRHADAVGSLLRAHGAGEDVVARVGAIVRKEGLGSDPAVQVHEDALCLVFLETGLTELAESLGEQKSVDVLRRTARKMSPAGLAAAATVPLEGEGAGLLARALGGDDATDRTG